VVFVEDRSKDLFDSHHISRVTRFYSQACRQKSNSIRAA
jgi:hypothetical protein